MNTHRFLVSAASAFLLVLSASAEVSVTNLPTEFYARPGLSGMPKIDYAAMKVVNVRDCGAVGDGEANECQAFDRAIRELQPAGGVVFIPKGRYYFAPAPLPERRSWVPKVGLKGIDNIHFVGEGDESQILFRHPPTYEKTVFYGWDLGGSQGVSLRDLRFVVAPFFQMRWEPGIGLTPLNLGSGSENMQLINVSTEQGRMGIVCWQRGKNIWVVDCDVRNTGADAIHFRNGNGVTVAYSYVENSGDDGIALWLAPPGQEPADFAQWGRNYRALYNVVVGTRWGRGIAVSGTDIEVKGNWVEDSVFAGIGVMDHDGTDLPPSKNVVVRDNTILRAGIGVREDNNLTGHNVGAGILVATDVESATIEDNTVLLGENEGLGLGHPFPIQAGRVELRRNVVLGNRGPAFKARPSGTSTVKELVLDGNTFLGNSGGATDVNALVLPSTQPTDLSTLQQAAGGEVPEDSFAVARSAPRETAWDLPEAAALDGLPIANVRDLGARGDGQGNDLEAFEKAIAALPEGGVIVVPKGRYRLEPLAGSERSPDTAIRQHLLVRKAKGLHFRGEGRESVIVFTSPDHQGLRFLESENCSVRDLALQGDFPRAARRNRALLDFSASTNVASLNVEMAGSAGPGILLDSSRRVLATGNRITDPLTEGIRVVSTRQALIADNTIERPEYHGVHVFWAGSICRDPQYVRITGNRILDSRLGAGVGVSSGRDIEVSNNTIERGGLAGVVVNEHARMFSPASVKIAGNTILGSPASPLSFVKGAIGVYKVYGGRVGMQDITIADNTVESPNLPAVWIWGNSTSKDRIAPHLEPYAVRRMTITGNQFTAPIGIAIEDSLIERLTMTGNVMKSGGELLKMEDVQRGKIKDLVSN